MFKGVYSYLKALKKIYFNKKLWSIYYIVRKKYFKQKYFQFKLFAKNYFKTNIKFDRFYKTHLRFNTINNIFSTKLYKFFIIYKFLQFKKLSTIIFDKQLLDSVFLKLIISQVFTINNNIFNQINNNKLFFKKSFNLFQFKNVYKFYKKRQKKILLTNLFLLLNKKNWIKFIKSDKKKSLKKIKFLSLFIKIKKNIFINRISNFIKFIKKKKYKFLKKKFNKIKFFNIYLNFFKNLNILHKKYLRQFSKKKYKKNKYIFKKKIYLKKNIYMKYLKYTKYFRFLLKKKIKHIKYNLYIHKFLFFMKNIMKKINWNKYKKIIYLFINMFFIKQKYIYNFFYNFFKKIIFNIFWLYILPNIKYYYIFNNKKNYININIKKIYRNIIYKNLKYKNLINYNLYLKKKKINIFFIIYLFLKNINYKKISKKILKKKNIIYYKITKNSYLNNLLKKLDNLNYFKKKINKYNNNNNNKKKLITYKNRYSIYNIWLRKHPFFNIIKYEYFLYLKNNPYKKNTINYLKYFNYNNFIKWKRNKLLNNINWTIFFKYSSNNITELFKDIFIRFKILYFKKYIYKNILLNSLFSILNNKKIFNKYNYFLGWFNFNKALKLKDWFYQKDFFLFPSWFYNYKRKKTYFLNISWKKKLNNNKYEIIKKITLKKNIIRFKILNFILKYLLFFLKKKKFNFNNYNINNFFLFRYNLKLIIMNTIFDYANIFWNIDYSKKLKSYMLNIKLFQLNQLFSLIFKRYYINKIRFNKKIHNWILKKKIINKSQLNILNNLSDNNKIKFKMEIWNQRKWYTLFMKKKKIKKYQNFWKNIIKYNKKSINYIYNYINIKNIKDELIEKEKEKKKQEILFLKNNNILKSFLNNSILFKKKYNHIFLNNFQISSSLNNLFHKFYNIPKFLFYKQIKIYLKNYKIIFKNKNFNKNSKQNKKNFKLLKLLNKNYNNNIIVDLSNFIKMYGFKWW
jgi:hypothetical protein